MSRLRLTFAPLLALAGCVSDGEAIPTNDGLGGSLRPNVVGSCMTKDLCVDHYTKLERLVETRRQACEDAGHAWRDVACPRERAIGRCVYDTHPRSGTGEIHYYYDTTPKEIAARCETGEDRGRYEPLRP